VPVPYASCFAPPCCLQNNPFFKTPVRGNPLKQLFQTKGGEEKSGYPSPKIVGEKGHFSPPYLVEGIPHFFYHKNVEIIALDGFC
jgi:hypothetical protein